MYEKESGGAEGTFKATAGMKRYAAAYDLPWAVRPSLRCVEAGISRSALRNWERRAGFAEWLMEERRRLHEEATLEKRRIAERRAGADGHGDAGYAVPGTGEDSASRPLTFAEECKLDWDTGGRELWEEEVRRREEAAAQGAAGVQNAE